MFGSIHLFYVVRSVVISPPVPTGGNCLLHLRPCLDPGSINFLSKSAFAQRQGCHRSRSFVCVPPFPGDAGNSATTHHNEHRVHKVFPTNRGRCHGHRQNIASPHTLPAVRCGRCRRSACHIARLPVPDHGLELRPMEKTPVSIRRAFQNDCRRQIPFRGFATSGAGPIS